MGTTSLSEKALTYDRVGVTLAEDDWYVGGTPGLPGYQRSVRIGAGPSQWTFASTEILRWGVKTRSGFSIDSDPTTRRDAADRVAVGRRYWLTAHIGPVRIREPVQVIAVIDDPDRKGFAYGTLTGHPVSGEEMFLVDRRADGSVWLTIRSVTRPAAGLLRAAYPLALVAQRVYRRRYFRSLNQAFAGQ